MSQRCLKGVPRVSYECLMVFEGCISSILRVNFISVFSSEIKTIKVLSHGCLKGVSRVSQGYLKGVSRVSQGCLRGVSRVSQDVKRLF